MRGLQVLFACVCLAASAEGISLAQSATIQLDEYGDCVLSSGRTEHITGYLAADPGPGGLGSALTFDLGTPPVPIVTGDLIIEDPSTSDVSDILRVEQATPSSHVHLVLYSADILGGASADTGLPGLYSTNTNVVMEVSVPGGIGWSGSPSAGEPGYLTGLPVTFTIYSSGRVPTSHATPEPGSIALLGGLSAVSAGSFMRRRRRPS